MALSISRQSMKITPCASQKTLAITFRADCCVFGRFGAHSSGLTHCYDPSRDSGFHVQSIVTNRRKNSFELRLTQTKFCSEVVARMRFWSIVSNRGNHLAQSLLMHKCVCKILTTCSVNTDTISAMSRTVTFESFKTILQILLVIYGAQRKIASGHNNQA